MVLALLVLDLLELPLLRLPCSNCIFTMPVKVLQWIIDQGDCMNLNFNEVGQVIRINVGKDISASTPTLVLQPEVGNTKLITSGVTIPTVQVEVNGVIFYPDEYIEYFTKDGDLDYVGRWKKRVKLDFSSTNIEKTDFVKFRVLS